MVPLSPCKGRLTSFCYDDDDDDTTNGRTEYANHINTPSCWLWTSNRVSLWWRRTDPPTWTSPGILPYHRRRQRPRPASSAARCGVADAGRCLVPARPARVGRPAAWWWPRRRSAVVIPGVTSMLSASRRRSSRSRLQRYDGEYRLWQLLLAQHTTTQPVWPVWYAYMCTECIRDCWR